MTLLPALAVPLLLAAIDGPPRTFRVDYVHAGDATREVFAVERLVLEPLPWAGNPARPVDETNSGKYLFEIRDRATNRLLYSRGFSSIYGEWETTSEARERSRAFGESLRFPAPQGPFQVVLRKRRPETQAFVEVWTVSLDPRSIEVDGSAPPSAGPAIDIVSSGDPAARADLLILGDGYTAAERGKFEADARRLTGVLLGVSPFKERRGDLNVRGLAPASPVSGISRPSEGGHKRTPLGATYDAFGSERYVLSFDNRAVRDAASQAPYEWLVLLVNGKTYGGGGIFNLYATVASDSLWAPYVFVHELGHHVAGLADEYFTAQTAYDSPQGRPEPWEPNATADPARGALKWGDLVRPGTPLPTPWDAAGWISWQADVQARRREIRARKAPEAEMDALFLEEKAEATRRLRGEPHAGDVGAFEGANYEAKGYFRPQADCIMFTRNEVPFCAVCRRALSRMIDLYAAP